MATCTEHLRSIIRTVNDMAVALGATKGMPSEVRVNPSQHGFLSGKPNGFIMTVESVPCFIDNGVTDELPAYKLSGGADATVGITADAGTQF